MLKWPLCGHARIAAWLSTTAMFTVAFFILWESRRQNAAQSSRSMPADAVSTSSSSSSSSATTQPTQPAQPTQPRSHAQAACGIGAVTVVPGGRFGNAFMEVASAWAVARASGLRLALPAQLRKVMAAAFRRAPLGLRLTTLLRSCPAAPTGASAAATSYRQLEEAALAKARRLPNNYKAIDDAVRSAREGNLTDPLVVLPRYVVLAKYIAPLAAEIRRQFEFHKNLREGAQTILRELRAQAASRRPNGVDGGGGGVESRLGVFVGIHARRTDYKKWLETHGYKDAEADADYFVRAVSRLRRDVQADGGVATTLVLVAVSDDMEWVRAKLLPALQGLDGRAGAVAAFAAGGGTLLKDLALLAACNHSVITYGTYGMTAALLAGGRVVAYNVSKSYPPSVFAQLDEKWTVMR